MSRDEGFRNADVAVAMLDDPKFRTLARSTRDECVLARCVTAYVAVVLASWGAGERVTLEDAAPLWLAELEDLGARLAAVELLDADGRIPTDAWSNWYLPAEERQEKSRERWRRANRSRGRSAETSEGPRGDRAETSTPVPSEPNPVRPLRPIRSVPSRSAPGGAQTTIEADRV